MSGLAWTECYICGRHPCDCMDCRALIGDTQGPWTTCSAWRVANSHGGGDEEVQPPEWWALGEASKEFGRTLWQSVEPPLAWIVRQLCRLPGIRKPPPTTSPAPAVRGADAEGGAL